MTSGGRPSPRRIWRLEPLPREVRLQTGGGIFLHRLHAEDNTRLTPVFLAAYRDTVDDEDYTVDSARAELDHVWRGRFGYPIGRASFVATDAAGSVCGFIVTTHYEDYEAPLVVFVVTAPSHQRRGIAGRLLAHALAGLVREDYDCCYAVITQGNAPSERLFARAGFAPIVASPSED